VLRYSANLSILWPDLDFYDRFQAASDAGFRFVEMGFPHELDTGRIERLLSSLDLRMVLFNPYAGDWDAGERGILTQPGREADVERALRDAFSLTHRWGTHLLNPLAGLLSGSLTKTQAFDTAVANLRRMAPRAQEADVVLLVEGINSIDLPGFAVDTTAEAAALVRAVGHPNVRMLLDVYHVAMAGEDPMASLQACFPLMAHVHVADTPGRHEPGTGNQPIAEFLRELDRMGYQGFVGLEYEPAAGTDRGLAWMKA
jgi:hydroxypyruvate isomerase